MAPKYCESIESKEIKWECVCVFLNLLVCITVCGGGEVYLHDHLELGLVAAVFEGGVVVVAAEHVGLVVVCEARAVKAEVVTPLTVGVGFTHSVMSREGCRLGRDKDSDANKLTQKCQTGGILLVQQEIKTQSEL